MGSTADEKTEEKLRQEIINELLPQQRQSQINERLRSPPGFERGGLSAAGPCNFAANVARQGDPVRPFQADGNEAEDQPPAKRRLLSGVVKVEDGETIENDADKEQLAEEGNIKVGNDSNKRPSNIQQGGWSRRDGTPREVKKENETLLTEHMPGVFPKNECPSLVSINKRMREQLLGTLEVIHMGPSLLNKKNKAAQSSLVPTQLQLRYHQLLGSVAAEPTAPTQLEDHTPTPCAMSRIWTDSETDAFVTLMEEAVTAGHRADNGQFKPGTFQILAHQMVEKFPECGIDRRHVKNKHKRLKDKYQTAFDMLNCIGFGWNESKQCVEVDSKQVLDEWMRRHPNKYYTPGKPFPLYPRLEFVFGRDRATGGRAQNVVVFHDEGEIEGEAPAAKPTFDDPFDRPTPETTHPPTTSAQVFGFVASFSNTAGNQQNKRKRKMRDSEALESLALSFARAIETSKENAKVIADAIAGMQGAKLGEELVNFGFPVDEIVRAGKIFGRHAELMNIYWGLPPELKQAYFRSLLDSDI